MDELADELRQKEGCLPTEEQKRCDQIWNSDGLDASGDPIEKTPYDDFCDVVQKEVPEAEKLDPKGERQVSNQYLTFDLYSIIKLRSDCEPAECKIGTLHMRNRD